jgi:hypothetical protein
LQNSFDRSVRVALQLVLPQPNNSPSEPAQLSTHLLIPLDVAQQFRAPVFDISGRLSDSAPWTGMPKTSINEHADQLAPEDDIRTAGQIVPNAIAARSSAAQELSKA